MENNWKYLKCPCSLCLPKDIMDRDKYELQYKENGSLGWQSSGAGGYEVVKSNISCSWGEYRYRRAVKPKKTHADLMTMWHRQHAGMAWFKVDSYTSSNGDYWCIEGRVSSDAKQELYYQAHSNEELQKYESVVLPPE